jgi:hypothetical protein
MRNILKFGLLFVFFTIFVLVYSCGKNVSKLQGKWSASGNVGDSIDMHSWYIDYEFDGRNYKMSGYPPISEEGAYEIVQEKGDSLQIYFNVTKSSPETKSHKDWLVAKDSTISLGSLTLRRSIK